MNNFIKNKLIEVRDKQSSEFDYKYTRADRDVISVKGTVKNGLADFEITRTKSNGHQCSSIPVFGMPLTDESFNKIAEIAVENL